MSSATASTCAAVRATSATDAPASTKQRAMASPIPRPPPVISATLSASEKAFDVLTGFFPLSVPA
jgi:hypothetical protein